MYIKDGSNEVYCGYPKEWDCAYSWGWLGNKVESTGCPSEEIKKAVVEKLSGLHPEKTIYHTRGFHVCEMCRKPMGNAEIFISHEGQLFIAPSDVVHYIEAHDYWPDEKVVGAVLNGVFLSEDDLIPDWNNMDRDRMTDEEIDNELDKKLKEALAMGMFQNRQF